MDPVLKLWMFENWIADQRDQGELAKNHAYLLGSFINPEAVKQLTDTGNKHESTEEEFAETIKLVENFNKKSKQPNVLPSRRRRLPLKG